MIATPENLPAATRRALICGVSGQDGAYPYRLLHRNRSYEVIVLQTIARARLTGTNRQGGAYLGELPLDKGRAGQGIKRQI